MKGGQWQSEDDEHSRVNERLVFWLEEIARESSRRWRERRQSGGGSAKGDPIALHFNAIVRGAVLDFNFPSVSMHFDVLNDASRLLAICKLDSQAIRSLYY